MEFNVVMMQMEKEGKRAKEREIERKRERGRAKKKCINNRFLIHHLNEMSFDISHYYSLVYDLFDRCYSDYSLNLHNSLQMECCYLLT